MGKITITLLGLIFGLGLSQPLYAASRDLSSKTCEHGGFSATGPSLNQARASVSLACLENKTLQFEQNHGRVPSNDEADEFLEDCLNICDR